MRHTKTPIATMIGRIIQAERNRQTPKMTQEELAHLSNTDRSYLSLVEKGFQEPSVTKIFEICKGLGIKPAVFFRRLVEDYEIVFSEQEESDE